MSRYLPETHLHDDIVTLLHVAIPDENGHVSSEKLSVAIHGLFRTVRWEHDANYYARRNSAAIYDGLRDCVILFGANIATSWDGEEFSHDGVRAGVRAVLDYLQSALGVELPYPSIMA